jgi:hypothetical protein
MTRRLLAEPRPGEAAAAGSSRRRRVVILVTVGAILAVLAMADIMVRSVIEHRIEVAVEQKLATGAGLDATVTARVSGPSALLALVGVGSGGVQLDVAVPVSELGSALAGGEALPDGANSPALSTDGGLLVVSTTAGLGGSGAPLGVELRPEVTDGALTLVPVAVRVAGATFSVDLLAERGILAPLADPRTVNLGVLPEGVRLTDARVDGDQLVLQAHLDDLDPQAP